jgi:hypothetical protein
LVRRIIGGTWEEDARHFLGKMKKQQFSLEKKEKVSTCLYPSPYCKFSRNCDHFCSRKGDFQESWKKILSYSDDKIITSNSLYSSISIETFLSCGLESLYHTQEIYAITNGMAMLT